jgi:hypothetical protein
MLLEETCTKLNQMKLYGMLESVRTRVDDPTHRDLSVSELIGLIVDDEWLYRENRKLTALLKKARFKEKAASSPGRLAPVKVTSRRRLATTRAGKASAFITSGCRSSPTASSKRKPKAPMRR